jgi:aminopeptidase N
VQKVLAQESNALLIDLAGDQLLQLYFGLLSKTQRNMLKRDLEESLWTTMLEQSSAEMTKQYFELCAAIALSDTALKRLQQVWSGELEIDQLVLEEPERIALAERLALRLPAQSEEIIAAQMAQITNPDRRRRLEFIAPALSADPAIRDRFFRSLAEPQNRATEVWVAAAVRYLHDPTRLEHAIRYIQPSLELLEEIQVTGDIFFPSAWLDASLASHSSSEAAAIVQQFLQKRPEYNPQLRMKILQAADPLFRASRLLTAGAGK